MVQLDRKMTPNHKSIVEMLHEVSRPVEVSTVGTEEVLASYEEAKNQRSWSSKSITYSPAARRSRKNCKNHASRTLHVCKVERGEVAK
mmetsp:Transcript_6915/g.10202  ORF Transcript_6915/g.10202 Transcript_6915/m.10202 type:complete len:88 (+) Transcript_6915:49-312(+)